MQRSTARLLSSEGSGLLNELSSLVFPTLTLVRASLLRAGKALSNCSFFQIQLTIWHFHPQTLNSFRNFHWKSQARFPRVTMPQDSSGLATFISPYVLIKRAKLLTKREL